MAYKHGSTAPAPFLTEEEVADLREKLKPYKTQSQYSLDVDKVADDLDAVAQDLPKTPRVIRGEEDLQAVQESLRHVFRLRRKLTVVQHQCFRAKTFWGGFLDVARGLLLSHSSIAKLRNETLRNTAVRVVLGANTVDRYNRLQGHIKEIEGLLWALKDNQAVIVALLETWKEAKFAHRSGMD